MKICETPIPGAYWLEPQVYADQRGAFWEAFQEQRYRAIGIQLPFVQDNMTFTRQGAIRGLHYQIPHPQGKLVWAITGEILDVAVDLRRSSPAFGTWYSIHLSAANRRQFYLPPGTAHGFCVLSPEAHVLYKCTDYYFPEYNQILRWDDPTLGIPWPTREPLLSAADSQGQDFASLPYFDVMP